MREGRRFELPTAGIVVGDLVEFKYGNTFPCDGLLVQGNDVRVNEASLTGESEQLKKTPEKNPFLYAGTQVSYSRETSRLTQSVLEKDFDWNHYICVYVKGKPMFFRPRFKSFCTRNELQVS